MQTFTVNWWAILAAVGANFVIGGLWYSPVLFMRPWMKMSGVPKPLFDSGLPKALIGDLVASFLAAVVLQYIIRMSGAASLGQGFLVSFGVWLGFILPVLIGSVTYEHKPVGYFAINAGFRLAAILIMGWILTIWR